MLARIALVIQNGHIVCVTTLLAARIVRYFNSPRATVSMSSSNFERHNYSKTNSLVFGATLKSPTFSVHIMLSM